MAKKNVTGTMTVTFKVQQTGGDTPEMLDGLEAWVYEDGDWDGLEVCFQDPEQEETVVVLEVTNVKTTTG
jgi:hypothetical protein